MAVVVSELGIRTGDYNTHRSPSVGMVGQHNGSVSVLDPLRIGELLSQSQYLQRLLFVHLGLESTYGPLGRCCLSSQPASDEHPARQSQCA